MRQRYSSPGPYYVDRASVQALDETLARIRSNMPDQALSAVRPDELTSIDAVSLIVLYSATGIGFAIRRLCQCGYLLAAELLLRPLVERIAVQHFLRQQGTRGLVQWLNGSRPSISKSLRQIVGRPVDETIAEALAGGWEYFNKIFHADPLGAGWHAEDADGAERSIFSSSISPATNTRFDTICQSARDLLTVLSIRVCGEDFSDHEAGSAFEWPADPFAERPSVRKFDSVIGLLRTIDGNSAEGTREDLSLVQLCATRLLPHAVSLLLGVRELIAVGQLVPAHMLVRPVLERITIQCGILESGHQAAESWLRGQRPAGIDRLVSNLPKFGQHPFDDFSLDQWQEMVHARPKPIFMALTTWDGKPAETLAQTKRSDYCDSVSQIGSFLAIYLSYALIKSFPGSHRKDFIPDLLRGVIDVHHEIYLKTGTS